ncbi:MAG: DUF882 domain-containing protein [Deltaproteobacteria bacterium]|nr:DUF882 domain-containing protein [Deltaproteobacteria bacterium]
MARHALACSLGFAALFTSAAASADVQHTVGRGHTIAAIANRYHVSEKAIIEANHLKNVKSLRVGDVLTIPTKDKGDAKAKKADDHDKKPSDDKREKGDKHDKHDKAEKADKHDKHDKHGGTTAHAGKPSSRETTNFAMKPKTPGVVHVKRIAHNEEVDIHVGESKKGRISPTTLKAMEKMMRAPGNMAHPIDARLVTLLGIVSDHFGSRKIEVISGFRPYTPTQYTQHSNHNHGKAIDFRVVGVPNEAVRDFCRTLKNTGCGYYPNSVFVHMDVREQSAFWIDYSKPGEAPRYNAPNVEADEGTSDVHGNTTGSDNTAPSEPANGATQPGEGKSDAPAAAPAAAPASSSED